MTIKKLLITLGIASMLLLPSLGFAQTEQSEQIRSFDSRISVNADSSLDVAETIVYDFGDQQKHGIYRDIPLSQVDGAIGVAKISGLTVSDETGVPYTINDITYSSNDVYVKVGDANKTITGVHTYVIRYHVLHAIGYFDSYDEIYWNATGNAWEVPILSASATVILPSIISEDKLHYHAYCGESGASDACGAITVGKAGAFTTVTFSSDEFTKDSYFNASEGMTIAVGFPKGIVAVAQLSVWEKDSTYYAIAIGIFALFFLWFILWALFSYLPKYQKLKRPIIAEYEPPQGITPSMAGYIYSKVGISGGKMATADILHLAAEGYVTIDGSEAPKSTGNFGSRIAKPLKVIGLIIFIGLFFSWWLLLVGVLVALFHFKETKEMIQELMHPMRFELSRTTKALTEPAHLVSLYNIVTALGAKVDLDTLKKETHYSEFDTYKSEVILAVKNAETEGAQSPKKNNVALFFTKFFLVCFFIMILFVFGANIKRLIPSDVTIPFTVMIDVVVFFVSVILFSIIRGVMKSKLEHMSPLWYSIAGLREYIKVAEKDRIKFESNPSDSARIFSKLLPYATAFGLEEKWASVFGGIVTTPPEWYHSTSGTFSAGMFVSSVHSLGGSMMSAASSGRPSSSGSGGSSGGGSSGGGGGGGGGGSW